MWILYLNSNGTVNGYKKLSYSSGMGSVLKDYDYFGASVSYMGDHDGAGGSASALAVGAVGIDDGDTSAGGVWIVFLTASETVYSKQKISQTTGGLGNVLDGADAFGVGVASLGDLDGDGVGDLAVGARGDDDGGTDKGAVWILFLNSNGTVKSKQKISATQGGFDGTLTNGEWLGKSMSARDFNHDGIMDLAVGAPHDDDVSTDSGAVWLMYLATNGTVMAERKISAAAGGFGGTLELFDNFGFGLTTADDIDGDGLADLIVGAPFDDDGGDSRGAVWTLCTDYELGASATWRNPSIGGHTNPDVYSVTSTPVLGGTFSASVDTGAAGNGCFLVGYGTPLSSASPLGNLLVNTTDPGGELLGMPSAVGNPAVIDVPVPMDITLIEVAASTQALLFGTGGLDLTNAQDLVVGF